MPRRLDGTRPLRYSRGNMDAEALVSLPPALLWPVVIGVVVIVIVALLKGVESGVSIWRNTRPDPPIARQLGNLATKGDVQAVDSRMQGSLKEMEGRVNTRIDEIDTRQTEEIRRMRSYNSKTTGEIFDLIRQRDTWLAERMEKMEKSTQNEFKAIAKEIGQLQGPRNGG